MYDPNGLELWRERRAELPREAESHRLAFRSRTVPREKSTRHPGRPGLREALRMPGEAT